MAEQKEKRVVILNRGLRTYHVHTGKVLEEAKGDKPAVMEIVTLVPQGTVEVGEKEAKNLLGYSDLVDAEKAAPQLAITIEALREENAKLKAELETLRPKDDGKKGK